MWCVVCGVWCVVRGAWCVVCVVWCDLVLCVLRLDEQVNDKGEVKLCDFGLARLKNTAFVETVSNTAGLSLSCLFRVACVSFSCVAVSCSLCWDCRQHCRCVAFVSLSRLFRVSFVSLSCRVCIFFVCCSLCRDRQQHCRCVSVVSRVYLFRVLQCVAAFVETVSSTTGVSLSCLLCMSFVCCRYLRVIAPSRIWAIGSRRCQCAALKTRNHHWLVWLVLNFSLGICPGILYWQADGCPKKDKRRVGRGSREQKHTQHTNQFE